MSAVKFDYPPYKLFEPQYHPQRPIIVDADAIESPDTVTLRYEEEAAARANGGDLRGDSPPGLLSMSGYSKPQPGQMHAFDSSRSYPDPQYQYSAQHFNAAQQSENEAVQLNQMAFAANNAASQYMAPVLPTLISYQPTSGVFGTKILVKISAAYDLIAVTSHFFLGFGSHKSLAHAIRDTGDSSGYGYVVSADAPQPADTRSASASVPLSLFVETSEGQTLASIEVGTFTYHDTQAGAGESPTDSVTRKDSKSPEQRQSPPRQEPAQLTDGATNSFVYPHTASQAVPSGYDPSFSDNGTMLGTYHRTSYATDYHPRPPPLKTSSWSPYASSLAAHRSSRISHHAALSRPSLTALPPPTPPTPSAPALIRTSCIPQGGQSISGQYNSYHVYPHKADLNVVGDLQSMELGWTTEEWENRRRIVMFSKKLMGTVLTISFRPISVNERPTGSICISCIYWAEKDECYVTSVDTISLLEQLLQAPQKFSVEEKNRIRRNLEGFRPLTVSKSKAESEEFFRIIMGFPNPKPRNIEKDVKVFPWKILGAALKKIVGKYSLNPASALTAGPNPALLTPVSNASPGLYAPPPPYTPAIPDNSYSHHDSHVSPRSVSGTASTWTAYPTSRTLSPSLKAHSPQSSGLRMPSIPSYATIDSRQQQNQHAYSANGRWQDGLTSHMHSRWDTPGIAGTNGYGDGTGAPPYTNHHQHHSQVYGSGTYGEGSHRE
ncbi:hypothetical protein DL771_005607 [Monosporascus sp. 5C6A]|nr:hypothetical protein DL771_005607 [Monosporascus sp. 5C6A]